MQLLSLPSGFTVGVTRGGTLNASGQAAGTAWKAPATNPQVATAWNAAGIPTALTSTDNQVSYGNGINDGGDVTGYIVNTKPGKQNGAVYPYLWQFSGGTYTAFQIPIATGGYGWAVNNLRQVLGSGGAGVFLWLPVAAYGLPQGVNAISGLSVWPGKNLNNAGLISGYNAANHLCLWVPPGGGTAYGLANGLNDLGNSGLSSIYPYGINNPPSGQPLRVVGNASDAAGNGFAFVWDSTTRTIQDLNTLVVNLPAGWSLTFAYGLNDLGQIVGEGTVGGVTHGFVLTPQ
jgi:uncharacterized membrane protein